jgi:hypothetical protein
MDERMKFQAKLFNWPEKGNHVIVIASGGLDAKGWGEMFHKIGDMTRSLADCKVLVELVDSTCKLQPAEIETWVTAFKPNSWPSGNKTVLVSPSETEQYIRWLLLSDQLAERGLNVAVFYEIRAAIDWLAQKG